MGLKPVVIDNGFNLSQVVIGYDERCNPEFRRFDTDSERGRITFEEVGRDKDRFRALVGIAQVKECSGLILVPHDEGARPAATGLALGLGAVGIIVALLESRLSRRARTGLGTGGALLLAAGLILALSLSGND